MKNDNDSQERMHQLMFTYSQKRTQKVDSREGEGREEDDKDDNENEAGGQMLEQEAGREGRGQDEADGQSEEEDEGEGVIDEVGEQKEEVEVRGRAGAIEERPVPEVYNEQIYEERGTPTNHLHLASSDYFTQSSQSLQMHSPSPLRSWN